MWDSLSKHWQHRPTVGHNLLDWNSASGLQTGVQPLKCHAAPLNLNYTKFISPLSFLQTVGEDVGKVALIKKAICGQSRVKSVLYVAISHRTSCSLPFFGVTIITCMKSALTAALNSVF